MSITSHEPSPGVLPAKSGRFSLTPAGSFLGAEIDGLDLSRPLDAATLDDLDQALADYGVLIFRDQDLTPEAHIALGQGLGGIDVNRFFKPVEGYPQIAEVRKEPGQKANIGGGWHTDHSYDIVPAKASILYAHEVPRSGGDTLFASAVDAFESLSPGLRTTLRGLRALHSSRHVFGMQSRSLAETDLKGRILNPELATQDAVHPVAITHPRNGRTALYVNPGFTVRFENWTAEESAPLLAYLYGRIQREDRNLRVVWRPGTVVIWDNRTTWHHAVNDYSGERRLLHRITVRGEALH